MRDANVLARRVDHMPEPVQVQDGAGFDGMPGSRIVLWNARVEIAVTTARIMLPAHGYRVRRRRTMNDSHLAMHDHVGRFRMDNDHMPLRPAEAA
jgi:hypothetical protein